MKKFVLAFGIPVLAVASLIGSGYATWYFNNDVAPEKGKIGVEPTPSKVVGAKFQPLEKITEGDIIKNTKLVLDQPYDATDGMPNDRTDVHFDGAFSESLVADDGDATNDTSTSKDKFVKGTSYTVTTTITIPSAVAKYVKFTFNSQTSNGQTPDTDGLITLKKEFTKVVDDTLSEFEVFNITEVAVEYTAEKPSTLAAYNTMADDVSGKTIGISFAAVIAK